MLADTKRRGAAVRFFVEWLEALRDNGHSTDDLDKVKFLLYSKYFNSDNTNDINIALLQALDLYQ